MLLYTSQYEATFQAHLLVDLRSFVHFQKHFIHDPHLFQNDIQCKSIV